MIVWRSVGIGMIHIPKTAGTSLCDYLNTQFGPYENLAGHYHGRLSEVAVDIGECSIFAVVREPVARARSFYKWFNLDHSAEDLAKYPEKRIAQELSFQAWLEAWFLPDCPCQSDFFLLDEVLPDNVCLLRFEHLLVDMAAFLDEHLLPFFPERLPHHYPTDGDRLEVSSQLRELIYNKEGWLRDEGIYECPA